MGPVRVDVAVPSHPYAVTIADGVLDRVGRLLDDIRAPERRVVVSSPLVWRLHGAQLARAVPGAEEILVPDGERSKQLPTVTRIYDALVKINADRATTLVTFGGGVIGDMAGFAAATYLRGIALVHVPTTLLAQVDSAIGGKVGVNHPVGKNLIGAFYQPDAVFIDPTVLSTLPRREFRAGLYEVIKYGMTSSAPLFDRLGKDYRRFRHGEAVGYGMLVVAEVARQRGALASADRQALADLIASLGPLPPVADVPSSQIVDAMKHDKKMVAGRLHVVLPTAVGATTIVDDVTEKEMREALKQVGFKKA